MGLGVDGCFLALVQKIKQKTVNDFIGKCLEPPNQPKPYICMLFWLATPHKMLIHHVGDDGLFVC